MKRRLLTLVLLLAPIFTFGQSIEFMGMSLNTDFETFCKNLKTKGLVQKIDRFETREFVGTFATYPDCRILVNASNDRKKIQSVEVIFESVENKKYDRDRAYTNVVNQYKSKYTGQVKEMEQNSATKMMNVVKHTIKSGAMEIKIQKFGPSIFDDEEECSMSILYLNKSVPIVEKKNNYSSDI